MMSEKEMKKMMAQQGRMMSLREMPMKSGMKQGTKQGMKKKMK